MAKPDPDRFRKWGELAGIGPLLVAAVLLGWWVGSKVDAWLGTAPWAMVLGVLLGTAGGFLELFRLLRDLGPPGGAGRRRRNRLGAAGPRDGEGGGES